MEQIGQFEVEVSSIKKVTSGGFQVRAFEVGGLYGEATSIFFRMHNYILAPAIGERITVTVQRQTCPSTTNAVPEVTDSKRIPLPDTISYRFREQADADFGAGTVKSQEEYQRLDAKWQEEHQE